MDWQQEEGKLVRGEPPAAAQRNRYFRGKLLTAADYETEQRYHIERRRLINRALLGWGVISGFAVEAKNGALRISPGLAFDPQGRELAASAETILERDTDMFWLRDDGRIESADERPAKGEASYILSAHYAEQSIDGVRFDDGHGDGRCEANRVCETVVFSLTRRASRRAASADGRGDAAPGPIPRATARLSRIGGVHVDPDAPVPIAVVTVKFGPSGAPDFAGADTSSPPRRPLQPSIRTGAGLEARPVPGADEALEMERLARENERLADENKELNGKVQKLDEERGAEIERLTRENEALTRKVQGLDAAGVAEAERLIRENQGLAEKLERLDQERDAEIKKLDQERAGELKRLDQERAGEIKRLAGENQELREKLKQLDQERAGEIKRLDQERVAEVKRLTAQNVGLAQQNQQLVKDIATLQARIAEMARPPFLRR